MENFDNFDRWMELRGYDKQIAEAAASAAREAVSDSEGALLMEEDINLIASVAIRVSARITADLLRGYHEWIDWQSRLSE